MKLKIHNINKMKKVKLVKSSILLGLTLPTMLCGCDIRNASDYYMVHNNGEYYICTKSEKYINSCDIDFISILDNSIVGSICLDNNNFDYQAHRIATDFLSELQIACIKDVLNRDSIGYNELINIAKGDINDIGEDYYEKINYMINKPFNYYEDANLKVFDDGSDTYIGYDMCPKRLKGTNDYVYSIIDKDVVDLSKREIDVFDIGDYYNDDNYITYDTALELVDNKELVKTLRK